MFVLYIEIDDMSYDMSPESDEHISFDLFDEDPPRHSGIATTREIEAQSPKQASLFDDDDDASSCEESESYTSPKRRNTRKRGRKGMAGMDEIHAATRKRVRARFSI